MSNSNTSLGSKILSTVFAVLVGSSVITAPLALAADKKVATSEEVKSVVNINKGGIDELVILKGVSEKKASAIIAYREKHGDFVSVEQLKEVKGIGDKTLEKNRSLIRL